VQDAVVEALIWGYFTEGADLNDRPTLVALAVQGGIPAAEAGRLLSSDGGRAEVLREEALYKSAGVSGVPSFYLGGELAFSGAAEPPLLAEAIRQAAGPDRVL
jgi:predicted DsbA family dithiol-disulfide isomerase